MVRVPSIRIDRRLDAAARPQRSEAGAERGDRHHREREQGQAAGQLARLGVRDLRLNRLVGDDLIDQGAEPLIDQSHLPAHRLGRASGAGAAECCDRLMEQALETADPRELLLLRGLGIADESQLREGQAA